MARRPPALLAGAARACRTCGCSRISCCSPRPAPCTSGRLPPATRRRVLATTCQGLVLKRPRHPWTLPTCVEIKVLRRVRAESSCRPPRHRRDASAMALVDFHTAPDLSDQLCAVLPARALVSWNSTPTYARFERCTTTSAGSPPGAGRPPGSTSQGSVDFGGSVKFASVAFNSASAFFLSTLGPFSSFFISRLCSAFFLRRRSSRASAGSSSSPMTRNLSFKSDSFNGYRSGGSKARSVTLTSGFEFLPALSSLSLLPCMSTITPKRNHSSPGLPTGA